MFRCIGAMIIAGLALATVACSASPEDEALTRGVFDTVRRGDLARIQAHLAPGLQTPDAPEKLAAMRRVIPMEPPSSIETESWSKSTDLSGETIEVHHRYNYPTGSLAVETRLYTPKGGQVTIETLKIRVVSSDGSTVANS